MTNSDVLGGRKAPADVPPDSGICWGGVIAGAAAFVVITGVEIVLVVGEVLTAPTPLGPVFLGLAIVGFYADVQAVVITAESAHHRCEGVHINLNPFEGR